LAKVLFRFIYFVSNVSPQKMHADYQPFNFLNIFTEKKESNETDKTTEMFETLETNGMLKHLEPFVN